MGRPDDIVRRCAMTLRILDTSLRDGNHALKHTLTTEAVGEIAAGLDEAGVPLIEVGHGAGLGGSSILQGRGPVDNLDYVRAAVGAVERATIASLLVPGLGTKRELEPAIDAGLGLVRVAVHVTEADVGLQHVAQARSLGIDAFGFLMMTHMADADVLVDQARQFEDAGATAVVFADSGGAMMMDDVRARVVALKGALSVPIGFHAHNNLSMAVANSVVAVEEGADMIDVSCGGLGAGAGNTQAEALVAVLNKMGVSTGVDLMRLAAVAERLVVPRMARPQVVDRASLLIGYAGIYSSFLLHVDDAVARHGVDAGELLLELGRRKVVGGQEDMIDDVALELVAAAARPGP